MCQFHLTGNFIPSYILHEYTHTENATKPDDEWLYAEIKLYICDEANVAKRQTPKLAEFDFTIQSMLHIYYKYNIIYINIYRVREFPFPEYFNIMT